MSLETGRPLRAARARENWPQWFAFPRKTGGSFAAFSVGADGILVPHIVPTESARGRAVEAVRISPAWTAGYVSGVTAAKLSPRLAINNSPNGSREHGARDHDGEPDAIENIAGDPRGIDLVDCRAIRPFGRFGLIGAPADPN